jgi:hypothetical protein
MAAQPKSRGLDPREYARLRTFMPEIAVDLSPNTQVRWINYGEEVVRIGKKGSLCIYVDHWRSYEDDENGGDDPFELIAFCQPELATEEIRRYVTTWLMRNPGTGSGAERVFDKASNDAKTAEFAKLVLRDMRSIQATLGETYFASRGLGANWPIDLVGYISDPTRPGENSIVGVITDAQGAAVGVQLGYLSPIGRKVETRGTERRHYYINRMAVAARFHIKPAAIDPDLPLLICEGLENALSLATAYPGAEVMGVPGIGRLKKLEAMPGRSVVVVRDGDAVGTPADKSLGKGVDYLLIGGAKVKVTDTPQDADANSILQESGVDGIRAIIETAKSVDLSLAGRVRKAALMRNPIERAAAITRLAERGTTAQFRNAVEAENRRIYPEDTEEAVKDIWLEPVENIAEVLDAAREEVARYVVGDAEQFDMGVMWSLHAHFVHHATIIIPISPRLLIRAPDIECGKTTAMEVFGALTPNSAELSSITAAGFFRMNDDERPTMLIDEIQGVLSKANEELVAILLSSHRRRSAFVVRVVEVEKGKMEARKFSTWGTYAATISGRMNLGLESRSLVVSLRKAKAGEVQAQLPVTGTTETLEDCRRKFARWAQDQLVLPAVVMPPALLNRRGNNWWPLFCIASLVGGDWPAKMEAAAEAAIKTPLKATTGLIPFLRDAYAVFGQRKAIGTLELISALCSKLDASADWNRSYRGSPITAYWLRECINEALNPPESLRLTNSTHGYKSYQFIDAWQRYCPDLNISFHIGKPESSDTSGTNGVNPLADQDKGAV